MLVAGLGTGGTLMGTGERLRESFPDVVVAAAEPLPGDSVMGLRSLDEGYVPPILDVSKLDRKVLVSNAESVVAVRALLDAEGIFAGVSAGAVVHVARRIAEELPEGSVVVTVLGVVFLGYVISWDGTLNLLPVGVAIAAVVAALSYFLSVHGGKHRGIDKEP